MNYSKISFKKCKTVLTLNFQCNKSKTIKTYPLTPHFKKVFPHFQALEHGEFIQY